MRRKIGHTVSLPAASFGHYLSNLEQKEMIKEEAVTGVRAKKIVVCNYDRCSNSRWLVLALALALDLDLVLVLVLVAVAVAVAVVV